jgi:hypothetical protein
MHYSRGRRPAAVRACRVLFRLLKILLFHLSLCSLPQGGPEVGFLTPAPPGADIPISRRWFAYLAQAPEPARFRAQSALWPPSSSCAFKWHTAFTPL